MRILETRLPPDVDEGTVRTAVLDAIADALRAEGAFVTRTSESTIAFEALRASSAIEFVEATVLQEVPQGYVHVHCQGGHLLASSQISYGRVLLAYVALGAVVLIPLLLVGRMVEAGVAVGGWAAIAAGHFLWTLNSARRLLNRVVASEVALLAWDAGRGKQLTPARPGRITSA